MIRKLKSNSGETLVETLFALLVVVLAMTMLAGSIISAARVNKGAENLDTAFHLTDEGTVGSVTVEHGSGGNTAVPIKAYQTDDQNKYCYYTTNGAG